MSKLPGTGLSAIELACLTARIPLSGTPSIDELIMLSIRFETAKELMKGLIPKAEYGFEVCALAALEATDALMSKFYERTEAKNG